MDVESRADLCLSGFVSSLSVVLPREDPEILALQSLYCFPRCQLEDDSVFLPDHYTVLVTCLSWLDDVSINLEFLDTHPALTRHWIHFFQTD